MTQNRRDFLKTTGATGAAWWFAAGSPVIGKERSPNERVQIAAIGVGGKGSSDSGDAARLGDLVALCDIDQRQLDKKGGEVPDAKKYNDYRKMIDELGDKIDAVTVSTPDHSHASASVLAMKAGLACFCQKPLTWSVGEARLMRELAEEQNIPTQMGNQGTSERALRDAVSIVKAGLIGEVKEVHVWTNRPIWPQGTGRPTQKPPVPKYLHWDLFLGPAPERPYHPAYTPFKWRGWLDFGTGALGDMACHTMNMPVMALDLFDPTTLDADSSGVFENETYPKDEQITYEFPERADSWDTSKKLAPVKLTWYDGGRTPPEDLLLGQVKMGARGALLIGEKATLYSGDDYCGSFQVFTNEGPFAYDKPTGDALLPSSPGHFEEFLRAIKTENKEKAMSNFGYAGRLTETVVLGNLAVILGKKVEWDAKNMKVKDVPEADKLIMRDYRSGWSL